MSTHKNGDSDGVITDMSDEDKGIVAISIASEHCNASDEKRVRRKYAMFPFLSTTVVLTWIGAIEWT